MCHGFVLVLLVDLVLCYVLTQRGAIMKQGKDSGMWLIGYIRLDSLTKTYMGKKVPLSRFLDYPLQNTCWIFNDVLQNRVFAKSLRIWQTITTLLSL